MAVVVLVLLVLVLVLVVKGQAPSQENGLYRQVHTHRLQPVVEAGVVHSFSLSLSLSVSVSVHATTTTTTTLSRFTPDHSTS